MKAYLEVIDGRYAGTAITISTGEVCSIGSQLGAELFLPDDPSLVALHFILICEETECQIRDCSGQGTFLNGEPITRSTLKHGDWVVAGETLFSFLVAGEPAREIDTPQSRIIQYLSERPEPLLALVDAALDPGIAPLLDAEAAQSYNFHEDTPEMQHATARPWLVALPRGAGLLESLVRAGWGKGWCVYLTSPESFTTLREHFRAFLVTNYAGGGDVGFRFFDPRGLRVLLPEFDTEQATRFFQPIAAYLLESQLPHTLLEFGHGAAGITAQSHRFSTPRPLIPSQQQLQEYFSSLETRGSFYEALQEYLLRQLPTETEGLQNDELLSRIRQCETESTRYGIQSQAARAQYVFLGVALSAGPGQIPEVDACLRSPRLSGEEKLSLFVDNFNLRRG